MHVAEIHSLREVLPQESVGVLVRATLPRLLWITEVHLDVGGEREALMIGQLLAAIPGQRLVEFPRSLVRLLDKRVDLRLGVLALDPDQHHVARVAFHQGGDLAVVAAEQQVTFPVARHCTVLDLGGALTDRDGVGDPAVIARLLRVMA